MNFTCYTLPLIIIINITKAIQTILINPKTINTREQRGESLIQELIIINTVLLLPTNYHYHYYFKLAKPIIKDQKQEQRAQ